MEKLDPGSFLVRTYVHLFGAVVAFVLLEVALFRTGAAASIARAFSGVSWLLVLGGFIVVGWLANRAAHRATSRPMQYAGLLLFVVAEALIFVPMLYYAERFAPGAIESAAVVTVLGFGGLTVIAMLSRTDFSFLGALLRWGGIVALILIVAAVLFGLHLGTWFSVAMIALAGASVLYDTSRLVRGFPRNRPAAAALQLFSSVAMMFWYTLRLIRARR